MNLQLGLSTFVLAQQVSDYFIDIWSWNICFIVQLETISSSTGDYNAKVSDNNSCFLSFYIKQIIINRTTSMNSKLTEIKVSHQTIKIPSTKRHFYSIQCNAQTNGSSNNTVLSESPFQCFKNQTQELRAQLSLGSEKSGFTKVPSNAEKTRGDSRGQFTQSSYLNQETCKYNFQQQGIIQLLAKQSSQGTKQPGLNTKNILRNICNAQNQFILFNSQAQKIIQVYLQISHTPKFKAWVSKLRFHTFEEFQLVLENGHKANIFPRIYKKLCRKFYTQNAIPYIMNSRIKNKQTKLAHIRYLYRFLEGLQNPKGFFYFKQKDKQKQKLN